MYPVFPPTQAKWFDVEDYLTHPLTVDGGDSSAPYNAYVRCVHVHNN